MFLEYLPTILLIISWFVKIVLFFYVLSTWYFLFRIYKKLIHAKGNTDHENKDTRE